MPGKAAIIQEGRVMIDSDLNPVENKGGACAGLILFAPVPLPLPMIGPSRSPVPYPLESLSIALPLADGLLRRAMAP